MKLTLLYVPKIVLCVPNPDIGFICRLATLILVAQNLHYVYLNRVCNFIKSSLSCFLMASVMISKPVSQAGQTISQKTHLLHHAWLDQTVGKLSAMMPEAFFN